MVVLKLGLFLPFPFFWITVRRPIPSRMMWPLGLQQKIRLAQTIWLNQTLRYIYIVFNTFYLNFYFFGALFLSKHKTVFYVISLRLSLPLLAPSKILTFPVWIAINLFYDLNVNVAACCWQSHSGNVAGFVKQRYYWFVKCSLWG